jgi:hypothetical protein
MMTDRGNRSTRRKPAPVSLCPPQNLHAARKRTRAAAVGTQRLVAWTTARPWFRITLRLPSDLLITTSGLRMKSFQSQSYFTTVGLPPVSSSWRRASWLMTRNFIFQVNTCGYSPYVTSSLTRGLVGRLQLLLVFASPVILRSETHGTHDHILLSQNRDSPNLEGQVPVSIFPRNRVVRLYSQALGSLFFASYDSQGCGGGIRLRLHTAVTWPFI